MTRGRSPSKKTALRNLLKISLIATLLIFAGCGGSSGDAVNVAVTAKDNRAAELAAVRQSVVPFFQPMVVERDDWLKGHPEDGQTFSEYLNANPTLPTAERRSIYIQPIGTFTAE